MPNDTATLFLGQTVLCAFAGKTLNAVIENCYSLATVSGVDDVGGLCGMFNSSKIINCFSMATVTGTTSVGGIVGSVNTSLNQNNPAAFENVYSMASIKGTNYVGIIAGYDEGFKHEVSMKNVYHSSSLPLSGSYTRTDGKKLTEGQMTDGTLLSKLNEGTKEGYTAWTASAEGYPIFLGSSPDISSGEQPEIPDDNSPIASKTDIHILTDGTLVGVNTSEGCLSVWREGHSATYILTGNYEGKYELIVYYADTDGYKIGVTVNGTLHSEQIRGGATTTVSWNASDAKSISFTVDMINGDNEIVFAPIDWAMGNIVDFDLVRITTQE